MLLSVASSCKCSPHAGFTCDAARTARRDPSGTLDLRRSFIRSFEARWRKVANLVTDAVVTQDMFGLKSTTARSLSMVGMQGGSVKAFQTWLDTALGQVVLGSDHGEWMAQYVKGAYGRGFGRAARQSGHPEIQVLGDRAEVLHKLTITELQGIMEVVSQQAVRAFGDGLMQHAQPRVIARAIRGRVNAVGVVRSRAMAEFMVVRGVSEATLDVATLLGRSHVSLVPETVPSPGRAIRVRDARRKKTKLLAEIVTAGDDDVCPECQDLEDDNPYTILEARSLIPAHPHCRCAWALLDETNDAMTLDEFNEEDHPRGPDGKFGSGGGTHKKKTIEEIKAQKVSGNSKERIALRKELKEAKTPEERKAINDKIAESFKKQRGMALAKGNHAKVAEMDEKLKKMGYGTGPDFPKEHNTPPAWKPQPHPESLGGPPAHHAPPATQQFTPEEQAHYKALADINGPDYAKDVINMAKKDRLPPGMTPHEMAHVKAYTGSAYKVNRELRTGQMKESSWEFTRRLNGALDKMPPYTGDVYRKAEISEHHVAEYYKPGMIVEERGFTSTSKNKGTWSGNVNYHIKSKTGRDVSPYSLHKSESEVLFKSGTRFKVLGRTGSTVHMEET